MMKFTKSPATDEGSLNKQSFVQKNIAGVKRAAGFSRAAITAWLTIYLGSGIVASLSEDPNFSLHDIKTASPATRKLLDQPFSPRLTEFVEQLTTNEISAEDAARCNEILKEDLLVLSGMSQGVSPMLSEWVGTRALQGKFFIDPDPTMQTREGSFDYLNEKVTFHWTVGSITRKEMLMILAHERRHSGDSLCSTLHARSSPQFVFGDILMRFGPVLRDMSLALGRPFPAHSASYESSVSSILAEQAKEFVSLDPDNHEYRMIVSPERSEKIRNLGELDSGYLPGKVRAYCEQAAAYWESVSKVGSGAGFNHAYESNEQELAATNEERHINHAISGSDRTVNESIDRLMPEVPEQSWPAQNPAAALLCALSYYGYRHRIRQRFAAIRLRLDRKQNISPSFIELD